MGWFGNLLPTLELKKSLPDPGDPWGIYSSCPHVTACGARERAGMLRTGCEGCRLAMLARVRTPSGLCQPLASQVRPALARVCRRAEKPSISSPWRARRGGEGAGARRKKPRPGSRMLAFAHVAGRCCQVLASRIQCAWRSWSWKGRA